jgi:Cdc6-like AAA superfamily ATPase
MLFGREKEIQKLRLNMQRGIHTFTFGAPGTGKTALLLEASSKLSTDPLEINRLTTGNPGAIARTLAVIGRQVISLDDPVRVRRMFVNSRMLTGS